MSLKINGPDPIIIAMWNPTNKRDLLDNLMVESVVQVFFPTMKRLIPTLVALKKERPAQMSIYRQSHTEDVLAVAKIAMFSIAAEGIRGIVAQEAFDRTSLEEEDDELAEPDTFLYPVIVTLSEPARKKRDDVPVVEATLTIRLTNMDNLIATEHLIMRLDPKTEIQTHLRSNKDTVLAVADFMARAVDEQDEKESGVPIAPKLDMAASTESAVSATSILSGMRDEYFTGAAAAAEPQ